VEEQQGRAVTTDDGVLAQVARVDIPAAEGVGES
jgi:hypothetical protein